MEKTQTTLYANEPSSDFTSSFHEEQRNGYNCNGKRQKLRAVTPHEVLHPFLFSPEENGSDLKLPLYQCLELLRRALERITKDKVLIRDILQDHEEPRVVRLYQTVSHPVDPLRWLHSQTKRLSTRQDPIVYFQNSESTLESAVCGSAITFQKSSDPNMWDLISNLPKESRLYGGERFDQEAHVGEEWKDFGSGMWILPAIELRTEAHSGDSQTSTTIAVHLYLDNSWEDAALQALELLSRLNDSCTMAAPCTTLPPVISRDYSYGPDKDGQEIFEHGVQKALDNLSEGELQKVVLARRMDLNFGPYADFSALDIIRRWKFGGHEGGNLMYLFPGKQQSTTTTTREFFGCTPERLFQIEGGSVKSEALAGTRPRGSTQHADEALLRDLFASPKDREENLITGRYVRRSFQSLHKLGLVDDHETVTGNNLETTGFFVRRLRHLMHICQRVEGRLTDNNKAVDVSSRLLSELHPTPAVCGFPLNQARDFIRKHERIGFDRGFYAGPFGCLGRDYAEIVVAIRSGLLSTTPQGSTKVSLFAGAGIVPGSNVQSEWAETSYKLGVISSLFLPSPITLKNAPTPNVAWTTAFVEELIRCEVTQFYICPGSRSTPLVAAIAKAVRSNVGIVHALSVHDERAAGFRAVGYGRGKNRPAAVITSSGTAVGNLYPSIMEAGMDGVPLLLLTADRPYENRDTGANQALDQVKAFSSTYIRWFRDIPPPSDDVPVSAALSDADKAVNLATKLRGPVHLNIQFRENLAPEGGPIRNDNRDQSLTTFNGFRFEDAPRFKRWSMGGGQWMKSFSSLDSQVYDFAYHDSVLEVAELIVNSRRGIIVVGNVRSSASDDDSETSDIISHFAQEIGFPVMAGIQSGSLRYRSSAVVPFAEHLLKHETISQNLKPDLVLQIGAPLVSTEIQNLIVNSIKASEQQVIDDNAVLSNHVLIHPHSPQERADPNFTVSHQVSAEIGPFLRAILHHLSRITYDEKARAIGSDLCPLVTLGLALQKEMPKIINSASSEVIEQSIDSHQDDSIDSFPSTSGSTYGKDLATLTEPQIALGLAQGIFSRGAPLSLFLSNSMPVRNAEFFLYPQATSNESDEAQKKNRNIQSKVGVNRGASGIDGIISSASGFAEATERPTTLLIGDLAALHDITAFHTLSTKKASAKYSPHKSPSLITVIVNNDGGGIFSFLPIAKHGADVSFDEFFGTPTNSFSFEEGTGAFGLPYKKAADLDSFERTYNQAVQNEEPCIIEAQVVDRGTNVAVYKEITNKVVEFLDTQLGSGESQSSEAPNERLPAKFYCRDVSGGRGSNNTNAVGARSTEKQEKTLLLLHGWMGDKSEWDEAGASLMESLSSEWTIVSLDLPGHGEAPLVRSSNTHMILDMLGLLPGSKPQHPHDETKFMSIDSIAQRILSSLSQDHNVTTIDAIAGYSLGGRVALAMRRLCLIQKDVPSMISDDTKMILLGAYPGDLKMSARDRPEETQRIEQEMSSRMVKDDLLAEKIDVASNKALLLPLSRATDASTWSGFVEDWYSVSALWGPSLAKTNRYSQMIKRRVMALSERGRDLAAVLSNGSPSRSSKTDWTMVNAKKTLILAGSFDKKYSRLGKEWRRTDEDVTFVGIPDAGHALLVEAPYSVADEITGFISSDEEFASGRDKEDLRTPTKSESLEEAGTNLDRTATIADAARPIQGRESDEEANIITVFSTVGSLDFERFQINLVNDDEDGVVGIGWGKKARSNSNDRVKQRSGFILNIVSENGSSVGVGETSPLEGLHSESMDQAESQLSQIKNALERTKRDEPVPVFDAKRVLALNGDLNAYIDRLTAELGIEKLHASVRSGIEMALLSLASQTVRVPILQAIAENTPNVSSPTIAPTNVPLNGLIVRRSSKPRTPSNIRSNRGIEFGSLKVKIGHQNTEDDALTLSQALVDVGERGDDAGRIRGDANRAWEIKETETFVEAIDRLPVDVVSGIEFVEEPLKKASDGKQWSLELQLRALERWYELTNIPYGLDETVADLAEKHHHDFQSIAAEIRQTFSKKEFHVKGCAAFVLKPALLGCELSIRLARMMRQEFQVGAVFSSSFDSGVGLAYTAFLGAASDMTSETKLYAHGTGTFTMLGADTISPPFSSYVDKKGILQVSSLSRALYGLGLDEIRQSIVPRLPEGIVVEAAPSTETAKDSFQSLAETSNSGREISVVGSLLLPFSDDVAASRFTDLPQMSRWSPWLKSVAYLDGQETEWTLNVRGVEFSWRAISSMLEQPHRGIRWESVSGLKNMGVVEFVPISKDSCTMRVKMTIITPRILSALFRGTSVFIEDFLQNKILKWSLEMFRDVVKGDLALERGDVELGDALFGAVEGRANAIEATLSLPVDKEIPTEDDV